MSSILTLSTIKAASSIRTHHTQHKPAPLTSTQRKEKAAQREENQTAIDTAVDEWFSLTTAKANELATRFNKKPRYFLDIFFHGGAQMVHHHKKVNPHNVFVSLKAQELREGKYRLLFKQYLTHLCTEGHSMSLLNIQQEYKEEYSTLGEDEREELVREYKENVSGTKHVPRPSPRGRVQDFSNTIHNIILLVNNFHTTLMCSNMSDRSMA